MHEHLQISLVILFCVTHRTKQIEGHLEKVQDHTQEGKGEEVGR